MRVGMGVVIGVRIYRNYRAVMISVVKVATHRPEQRTRNLEEEEEVQVEVRIYRNHRAVMLSVGKVATHRPDLRQQQIRN